MAEWEALPDLWDTLTPYEVHLRLKALADALGEIEPQQEDT